MIYVKITNISFNKPIKETELTMGTESKDTPEISNENKQDNENNNTVSENRPNVEIKNENT